MVVSSESRMSQLLILHPDLELCKEKPENPSAKMTLASKVSQDAVNGNAVR